MITKSDFLTRLHNDEMYKEALSQLDDTKRVQVSQFVEAMVTNFASVLAPLNARASADSEFAKSVAKEIVE